MLAAVTYLWTCILLTMVLEPAEDNDILRWATTIALWPLLTAWLIMAEFFDPPSSEE